MSLLNRIKKNFSEREKVFSRVDGGAVAVAEPSRVEIAEAKTQPEILIASEELKKADGNFKCEKCGCLDAWLPRAPGINADDLANWRCLECRPASSAGIIAQQRGPLWESFELARRDQMILDAEVASQTIVVALERPTCAACLCSWVIERPGIAGVDRFCWHCRAPIDAGVFEFVATNHRSRRHWKFPRKKKRTEAKNGSGQKLAGRR